MHAQLFCPTSTAQHVSIGKERTWLLIGLHWFGSVLLKKARRKGFKGGIHSTCDTAEEASTLRGAPRVVVSADGKIGSPGPKTASSESAAHSLGAWEL